MVDCSDQQDHCTTSASPCFSSSSSFSSPQPCCCLLTFCCFFSSLMFGLLVVLLPIACAASTSTLQANRTHPTAVLTGCPGALPLHTVLHHRFRTDPKFKLGARSKNGNSSHATAATSHSACAVSLTDFFSHTHTRVLATRAMLLSACARACPMPRPAHVTQRDNIYTHEFMMDMPLISTTLEKRGAPLRCFEC
jgi:hypothetical protein